MLLAKVHRCSPYRLVRPLHNAVLSFGDGSQGALGVGTDLQDAYEPEHANCLPPDVTQIAAGAHHSLSITAQGQLWTWGRNWEGQLGHTPLSPGQLRIAAPQAAQVEAVAHLQVVSAAASGVASFAATSDGTVWVWGSSKRGQLGLGPGVTEAHQPKRIPDLDGVRQLAAGWGHALALKEDGSLMSWGYPRHGRLGHSFAASISEDSDDEAVMDRLVWEPQAVTALEGIQIKQVACGDDHSLALSTDGSLFAFGDNSLGQLGSKRPLGTASSDVLRWLVRNEHHQLLRCRKVAAGLGHNLAVSLDGKVLSWGWNAGSQLGLGPEFARQQVVHFPRQIYGLPENPDAIPAAGRVHSVLLTDEPTSADTQDMSRRLTQAYAWGSGLNGRLGLGYQQGADFPEMIGELDGAEMLALACGHDHTLTLLSMP